MKYKVYTKWVGYSEIEVNAENEEEAREHVSMGLYSKEQMTGCGLDYGYEDEQVYKIEEIK
jgi:hypothetical protein